MNPEEIDKLFRERLKNGAPTPPVDLWSRLQDRMEAELPQQQPQEDKKEARRGFIVWVNDYAAAAAVTLLLSVGLGAYKYSLEKNKDQDEATVAQTEVVTKPAETVAPVTAPSEETTATVEGIAAAPVQEQTTAATPATTAPEAPAQRTKAIAKVATPKGNTTKPAADERVWKAAPRVLAVEKPAIRPAAEKEIIPANVPTTTAVFASNSMNAAPVEIMIKRTVATEEASYTADAYEASGIGKKQQLAKNIFKQVKNLANGESVELSELGIKADKIALETQIGKQKFSKVINL